MLANHAPAELEEYAIDLGRQARAASRVMALASTEAKNDWLRRAASMFRDRTDQLLAQNEKDLDAAEANQLTAAETDRLRLDPARIEGIAQAVAQIADLPDPVGELIERTVRPNGLEIRKVRVPLGVVLFIYESRPNVTADAAALCGKSGNAVILRGGREATHTNRSIAALIQATLEDSGLPPNAVQLVTVPDYAVIDHLLHQDRYIDIAIPRGGERLVRRVAEEARMPVLKHYQGICHVYVHRDADPDMARNIVMNAKCQRPGVCNAAECLLVDRQIAPHWLPGMICQLQEAGVEIRACARTQQLANQVVPASEQDYATEYLDLKLSVRVVDDLKQAIEHITQYGTAHTDVIVTRNAEVARQFVDQVDSSVVMVNASTRFNDGGEFGLGAEVGISTDKLHARGPCGLRELTCYKYVVHGSGQVRS